MKAVMIAFELYSANIAIFLYVGLTSPYRASGLMLRLYLRNPVLEEKCAEMWDCMNAVCKADLHRTPDNERLPCLSGSPVLKEMVLKSVVNGCLMVLKSVEHSCLTMQKSV